MDQTTIGTNSIDKARALVKWMVAGGLFAIIILVCMFICSFKFVSPTYVNNLLGIATYSNQEKSLDRLILQLIAQHNDENTPLVVGLISSINAYDIINDLLIKLNEYNYTSQVVSESTINDEKRELKFGHGKECIAKSIDVLKNFAFIRIGLPTETILNLELLKYVNVCIVCEQLYLTKENMIEKNVKLLSEVQPKENIYLLYI